MTSNHHVRLFAAARSAAGVGEVSVSADSTVELCAVLVDRFGPEFAQVLSCSSLLIDGRVVPSSDNRDPNSPAEPDLPPGTRVDVLPPFAGGSVRRTESSERRTRHSQP